MSIVWATVLGAGVFATWTPFDPATPRRLAAHSNVQPLLQGFVDVTKPPYSAAGDGSTDDAAALQAAIDDAYVARMSVFLPAGRTFMLSTQLRFVQPPNITGRNYGFACVGGRETFDRPRPVLRLQDGADTSGWTTMPFNGTEPMGGQGNCVPTQQDCTPRVFMLFQYLETRATSRDTLRAETFYLARLRGIDINLGRNPTVSAVSMNSAQLASIEDVRVVGTSFHAGFNGLPGSGGFSANLEVTGGDYGVVQNQFRPNPSIAGLRLIGQRIAGIAVDVSRGPLVISGFTIQGPDRTTNFSKYRAVLLRNPSRSKDNSFNGEDGVITLYSTGGGTAIETMGGDVILKNVYVQGAKFIVTCPPTGVTLSTAGRAAELSPVVRVPTYVLTASGGHILEHNKRPSYHKLAADWLSSPLERGDIGMLPWMPTALPLLHSWNLSALPSWDSAQVLNVMSDYGATPQWMDASDDDGAKIQKAIDDACSPESPGYGQPVFVPHGQYGIANPLDLRGGCAHLFGAGTHSTVLATLSVAKKTDCWPAAAASGAILTSLPNPDPVNTAQIKLVSDFNLATVSFCPFIDLRAGNLLLKDVGTRGESGVIPPLHENFDRNTNPVDDRFKSSIAAPLSHPGGESCRDSPYVALRNEIQGRFYGLALDGCDLRHCNKSPHHTLLLIEKCLPTNGAIHLYQASTEHLINTYQTLINSTQCGVHFHAWKYESALKSLTSIPPFGSGSLVRVQNSSNISVFGASGNYHLFNQTVPIIDVATGSSNISILGMVRMDSSHEPKAGLEWLVDENSDPSTHIDGYNALLLYRQ